MIGEFSLLSSVPSLDFCLVVFYLILVTWVGIVQSRKVRNIQMFATGASNFSTPVMITAAFATLVDGNDTIGLAASTYSEGLLFGMVCLGPVISLLFVAFVVAPKMRPFLGLISSGDILGKLYGRHAKIFTGLGVVVEATVLTAGQVMAIGYVVSHFFGFREDLAVITGGCVVLLYSARGGVMSVVKTDVIQFWVLIVPIPIICGIALANSGGLESVLSKVPKSHLTLSPTMEGFWRHIAMAVSLGMPALYPGAVQRMLMAKNPAQIRTVFSVTAVICLVFYGVVTLIGLIALATNVSSDPNMAFSEVVNQFMPVGIRGLAIAGLLAVITSTVGSHLNMAAVALVNDVITPFREKSLTDRQFVAVSRVSCVLIGLVATSIAAYFGNILESIFWVVFWGNPLFLPGIFWGIMGIKTSPRTFWVGLGSAACITLVYSCIFGGPDFLSSLLGTAVNSAVLLFQQLKMYAVIPKISVSNAWMTRALVWAQNSLQICDARKDRYQIIFLLFFIANSLVPFFIFRISEASLSYLVYFVLCIVVASLSFLLFFDESSTVYYEIAGLIFFVNQISFALVQSTDDSLWFFSVILFTVLFVMVFQSAKLCLVLAALGLLLWAVVLAQGLLLPINHKLVHWVVAFQVVSSVICLWMVWRKEEELAHHIQTESKNMVHSTQTLLAQFSIGSETLEQSMPTLTNAYQIAIQTNPEIGKISRKRLALLKSIPKIMQRNTVRLQTNVEMMLGKIGLSSGVSATESVLVQQSVSAALETFNSPVKWQPIGKLFFSGNIDFFELMLLELLKNASEAIQAAGRGVISIQLNQETRELCVEDTVGGVSAYHTDKIFEQHFTTKATGTGLGLCICKQVLNEWGGDLRCVSQEGVLTRFIIQLPALKTKQEIST